MKYSKDFLPIKGDRIIVYANSMYRILATDGKTISAKCIGLSIYSTFSVENVSFAYECPWYCFWQKF